MRESFDDLASELRHQLLAWWEIHGCHGIPWKRFPDGGSPEPGEVLDPYPVLVAEVMLQQTQLQVVLPYWQLWMAAFPSLEALAAAQEHVVLMLWQGLGYYSRALRLHRAARQLLNSHPESPKLSPDRSGLWPPNLEGWQALPGLVSADIENWTSAQFSMSVDTFLPGMAYGANPLLLTSAKQCWTERPF